MELAQRPFSSLVGTELGGFSVLEELATGGMGTVYLAQRSGRAGFGQPVAIKVIHPHLAQDRGFVEMFVDEARIASCVHHPNVCAVLEFGKARGTFYLAMEYLQGETWAAALRALRQRADGVDVALLLAHVVAQACEGLHAAHEATDQRGLPLCIVHRDVSPQNLFVGYDGGVRLLDFGIASAADRLHTTRFGTIKGRYSYMAPEQMLGESVDRRSDIWSLGVVLREGLTGRSVFRGATDAETVYAVTHRLVPPWEAAVHPELRRIADKAMRWEPELRYQSARELGMDLARFSQSAGVQLGMAVLSERMHALFPERILQKRARLHSTANDDGGSRAPFSLPPPPLPGEEAHTPHARGQLRARWPAQDSEQEQPTTRRAEPCGPSLHPCLAALDEPELEVPTDEQVDPAAEAPTWERDLAPTLDRGPRRPTTTYELLTVSRLAPARESGGVFPWLGLMVAAACAVLVALATPRLEPTRVVVTGNVRELTVVPHAASARRVPVARPATSGPRPEQLVAPARLPALEFAAAASEPIELATPPEQAARAASARAARAPTHSRGPTRAKLRRPARVEGRTGPSTVAKAPAAPPEQTLLPIPPRTLPPTGTLNITTLNGWAEVHLGTRLLGTTPGRFQLAPGTHTLSLRPCGTGALQHIVVEIRAGEVSRARVTLTP